METLQLSLLSQEDTTSSQADSLVRTTAPQINTEKGWMATALDSGLRCCESFKNPALALLWLKMFPQQLIGDGTQLLEMGWKRSVTKRSRLKYRQQTLGPTTSERDFSLLPTPAASDALRCKLKVKSLAYSHKVKNQPGGKGAASLSEAIAAEFSCCLKPDLVEWMMGYPPNWTLVESEDLEMP